METDLKKHKSNRPTRFVRFGILVITLLVVISCKKDDTGLPSNVDSVVLIADREMGYGGYYYDVYKPWVLFKDGTFIKEPRIPLDEINLQSLTTEVASRWGNYTYKGSGQKEISITYPDGYTQSKRIGSKAAAAKTGETIDGHFSSISGGGDLAWGGDIGILSYSRMSFTSDGWYTTERISGSNSSSHTAYHTSTTSGRYLFDGDHSIELTANNGQTKRFFFCWFSNAERHFRLAGRTFSKNSN